MRTKNEMPTLKTADLPSTINFYTDTLGFRVADLQKRADEPVWARLESDETSILFAIDEAKEQKLGRRLAMYRYTVNNVTELWERLKDQVDVTWLLESADSGVREFSFRDCNGYIINFSS